MRGSAFAVPFRDAAFDCAISSQVIDHIPYDEVLFREMDSVPQPGGQLIIGTPDYASLGWQIIQPLYGALLPGGYQDEHITHYTRESLTGILIGCGLIHEDTAYVARSELIMRFRKPAAAEHRGSVRATAARAISARERPV